MIYFFARIFTAAHDTCYLKIKSGGLILGRWLKILINEIYISSDIRVHVQRRTCHRCVPIHPFYRENVVAKIIEIVKVYRV